MVSIRVTYFRDPFSGIRPTTGTTLIHVNDCRNNNIVLLICSFVRFMLGSSRTSGIDFRCSSVAYPELVSGGFPKVTNLRG